MTDNTILSVTISAGIILPDEAQAWADWILGHRATLAVNRSEGATHHTFKGTLYDQAITVSAVVRDPTPTEVPADAAADAAAVSS